MMQLKLLGVLQDFGSPYASLYINDDNKNMYIAIEQDDYESDAFRFLLLQVTSAQVANYMENAIGLRRLSELSKGKYIWNKTKGSKGTITNLGHTDVKDRIDAADDMFDAEFCKNEMSIRYYIEQNL